MADRFYSEEQAQEILRLAARRQSTEPGMSRDRLIQAAAEMGIDPEAILAAEREVLQKQGQEDLRRQYVQSRRQEFYHSLSHTVAACIFFFGLNYLTSGGFHEGIFHTWAIWVCGFAILHMLKEGWEYFAAATPMGEREFEHWSEKQRKKQRVSEWIESHPDASTAVKVARMACAEVDADHKDHAVDKLMKETGLKRKDAKELVNAIFRESAYGEKVELHAKWATLERAKPVESTYEAARKALNEVGPGRRLEAVELVRARTGLGLQEAEEAVQAASELYH